MSCDELGALLTAHSLGELPEATAAAAREHLAGCDRCAALVLRDRELTSRLRASAVPAPAPVHQAVRAALAAERGRRRRRLLRRVMAVAAAAALAGVVSAGAAATARPGPLAAAWRAYQAASLPIERFGAGDPLLLGFVPTTPDLGRLGLELRVSGTMRLAGRQAFVTEYRSAGGARLAVFRWKGTLPQTDDDYPSGRRPDVQISRSGLTSSAWWDHAGVVWCAVGDLDQRAFERALAQVRRAA